MKKSITSLILFGISCFAIAQTETLVIPDIKMVNCGKFEIGKYEVTQAEWKQVMNNAPSIHRDCKNCPIENVSWYDVQKFIDRLNMLTGKKYRLPTVAEWEYAAKGGDKTHGYDYSGSNDIDSVAWWEDNAKGKSHPVGQKKPNELGIYDMTGNVWEWCSDGYDATMKEYIIKGGSWDSYPKYSYVVFSDKLSPYIHDELYGFRLARSR